MGIQPAGAIASYTVFFEVVAKETISASMLLIQQYSVLSR